ncbi:unnamed protein product, partial [Effrenium voratum]
WAAAAAATGSKEGKWRREGLLLKVMEVLWDRLNGLKSQQAVDVEGLRRRIMKEAEEAFQLKLNRPSQAGGSYTDEASFRTAQSDTVPPPPPPPARDTT